MEKSTSIESDLTHHYLLVLLKNCLGKALYKIAVFLTAIQLLHAKVE